MGSQSHPKSESTYSRMILVCCSNCYFCFAFYFIFIRASSFELFTRFIIEIRVIHSQRRIQHHYIPYAYPISNQTKPNVFYSSFMLMFFFSLKKCILFFFHFLHKTKWHFARSNPFQMQSSN